jgi:hypothetical protein
MTFAWGRPPSIYEEELLTEMTDSFRGGAHDFKAFMLAFIASDRFARRAQERL